MRYISVMIGLRSNRLGKIKIDSQKDFEKLLERVGALGLTPEVQKDTEEEEEDTVNVVTQFEELKENAIYLTASAADEGDDLPDYDEMAEEEEEEEEPERERSHTKNYGGSKRK